MSAPLNPMVARNARATVASVERVEERADRVRRAAAHAAMEIVRGDRVVAHDRVARDAREIQEERRDDARAVLA